MNEQSGESGGGTSRLNSETNRTAISTTSHNPREPNQTDSVANYGDSGGAARYFQRFDKGRWPSNIVLSHTPECVRRGVKIVKGKQLTAGALGGYGGNRDGHYEAGTGRDHAPDEEVEDWECSTGCPIAEMDRQGEEMGVHRAGSTQPAQEKWDMSETTPSYGGGFSGPSGMRYGDEGGASRFFQNLDPGVPFFYTAKAARSEKEDGLTTFDSVKRQNTHPTVKPISLMRYLVKMVTPPGGLVLDPFAGSGSTCIAAAEEGMQFLGIEREEEYVKIARSRVGVAAGRAETRRSEKDIFDQMMTLGDD
jgi:site-specific DNA-methyltransferase (adenine-specific)